MSRNSLLIIGAVLWAAVAVDTVVHVALGDWMAPAIAAILGVAFVAWRRVRQPVPNVG
jgi:hypothetical protein